ncbi:hypothetical protein WJT86_00725 [Microvirga sp. W0021]|uniref:DUF945 family protein n=1 Tax=Hohaiivirga grylli TaxID=3133970 RepID=A0ABV0BF29_9HYPH
MNKKYTEITFKGAAAFAIALSMIGTAYAGGKSPAAAYDVSFDNISAEFFLLKINMPKVEIKGSSLQKADIEKMFAKDTPVADRIKALSAYTANSIDIPTMTFVLDASTGDASKFVKFSGDYKDVKLEKVANGKIGKTSVANGGLDVDASGILSMNYNAKSYSMNDFNFVHVFRAWEDKAGPEDKEAVALYSSAQIESISGSAKDENGSQTFEYGKYNVSQGSKFKLPSKPLKETVNEVIAILNDKDAQKNKDEALKRFKAIAPQAIEFIENYYFETYTLDSYKMTQVLTPKGQEGVTINASTGKIEFSPKQLSVSDITVSVPTAKAEVKIGSVSNKGFSIDPLLATAKTLLAKPDNSLSEEDGMSLALAMYSNLGTTSFDNIDIKAVAPKPVVQQDDEDDEETTDETVEETTSSQATSGETIDINVKAKNFTFKLENPVNNIPSAVRISFDNLQFPATLFALKGDEKGLKAMENLKKVGLENLNVSYAVDASWNKDANELHINEIKTAEESMGSTLIKGTIGNFTSAMFTTDKQAATLSALGLLVKDLSLHHEDKGMLNKLIELNAEEKGITPEQIKSTVPMMAAFIPEPFASMESVKTIKDAALKFWANPGKLDISIKAKDGKGLGLADFMSVKQNPAAIDGKIDVKASASN